MHERFSKEIEKNRKLGKIVDRIKKELSNGRVKEWRVTLGITLAVSTVSSFVPV
jgi:hypothetical protein